MHPLCCIALDRHSGVRDRSPDPPTGVAGDGGPPPPANGDDVTVAGVLYKWTNYGRGWKSRWFSLRQGVISYTKIRHRYGLLSPEDGGVRLIGDASARLSSKAGWDKKGLVKAISVVYLKVCSRSQPSISLFGTAEKNAFAPQVN